MNSRSNLNISDLGTEKSMGGIGETTLIVKKEGNRKRNKERKIDKENVLKGREPKGGFNLGTWYKKNRFKREGQ